MANIRNVTPPEAKKLVDDEGYAYVDVRSVEEFEAGHPAGAVNVPVAHMGAYGMEPNGDFVKVMRANFAPDAKLVLGCKSGGRSMRAAEILAGEGYTDLVNMDGGFGGRPSPMGTMAVRGWEAEGLPVSTDAGDGVGYESLASKAK